MKNLFQSRRLTAGLFVVYFLTLAWLILGKLRTDIDWLHLNLASGPRSLNLVPFGAPLMLNGRPSYQEVWQNLLVFIPFGLYTGLLLAEKPLLQRLLPCFLASLTFELLQFGFNIGAADITDLLSNVSGGLLGLLLILPLTKALGNRALPVLNLVALVCTILLLGFISLIIIVNL